MITLDNDSVKVYARSIVFDEEQYRHPLYWLTAVGAKVALQGVFATLVNKRGLTVKTDRESREKYGLGFEYFVVVPPDGHMRAVYKKLGSGLSAMVAYSSLALSERGDDSGEIAVMLCSPEEDVQSALFHSLSSRIRVTLHKEWKTWLWATVMKRTECARTLTGVGIVGYVLHPGVCEQIIEKEIGRAVKKGVIKA
jgi:hypothetical protein